MEPEPVVIEEELTITATGEASALAGRVIEEEIVMTAKGGTA